VKNFGKGSSFVVRESGCIFATSKIL